MSWAPERLLPAVMRRLRRSVALAVAAMLAGFAPGLPAAEPYDQPVERLKLLSLEELMEIDVISVSRRPEPATDAAAAITVLTGEEIRRSGATTVAQALRLAPGLQVARLNNRTWAISARGFNITNANKLEVMIDGRSVYTPLLSGVFWDVQDTLLADVDRIEVIRGPGAAMWGANAVNGVINIITRRAAESQGTRLILGAGNEEVALAGARYGGRLGATGHYRVYGKYNYRDEQKLAAGLEAEDLFRKGQAGFRMDRDLSPRSGVTLQGDLYLGRLGQLNQGDTHVSGGNLLGRIVRRTAPRAHLQAQFYYDRSYRHVPLIFEETLDTWDFDLQHQLQASDHHVVWGAGYRRSLSRTVASPTLLFDPTERATGLFKAFAEDEFGLLPDRVFLTLGSKFEHNAYTGFEIQPSGRVRFLLPHKQMVWSAVSRAVRMPTRLENDARFLVPGGAVVLRGSRAFRSEELLAFEGGYRVRPVPGLALELAAFRNRYDHLRSQDLPSPPGPIVLANTLEATSSGLEALVRVQPVARVHLSAAYMRLALDIRRKPGSLDVRGGASEGNDPDHQLLLRASADLPGQIELDAAFRAVSALSTPPVPAYAELDARLGWPLKPGLVISLVGHNLLHDRHPEFGAAGPQRVELERSVSLRLSWDF
jgi:iron complex outermembrane recepter protein